MADISSMTLPNGSIYNIKDETARSGSGLIEMTKAQYDALSSAEKNDGKVRFITDANPVTPGSSIPEGGSAGQVLKKKSATDYDMTWQTEDLGITGVSVGDLVRISAVSGGKPTAFEKVPLNAIKCNRNLLDNWYFVGGGSQLGYGTFPINQRGQTVYATNEGFTVDKWKLRIEAGGNCNVVSSGLQVAGNSGGSTAISQSFTNYANLLGKTITLSVLLENITGAVQLFICNARGPVYFGTILVSKIASNGLNTITTTIPSALANQYLNFMVGSTNGQISYVIKAAKLEIGSTQTLAHQEAGVWVLNEIPDFEEELIACQHYAIVIPGTGVNLGYANSDTVIRISVPCPAQFVGQPSLAYGGNGFSFLRLIGNGLSLEPTAATASNAGNAIILEFTVSGATQNMPYVLKNNGTSILIFA